MSERDEAYGCAALIALIAGAVLFVSVIRALWAITNHFSR